MIGVAGSDLAEHLMKILTERGLSFTTTFKHVSVRGLTEDLMKSARSAATPSRQRSSV
jgi:hypothetical protein